MAKIIKPPKTARVLRQYREGGAIVAQLCATRSAYYAWEREAYSRVDAEQAQVVADMIDALNDAAIAEAERRRKIWAFVENARELRERWSRDADRILWAESVEHEYLSRYVVAQDLDERIALRLQRDGMINALDDGVEMEEIPNPWEIEGPHRRPTRAMGQLSLKLRNF